MQDVAGAANDAPPSRGAGRETSRLSLDGYRRAVEA
jgi:hypothetical protein